MLQEVFVINIFNYERNEHHGHKQCSTYFDHVHLTHGVPQGSRQASKTARYNGWNTLLTPG